MFPRVEVTKYPKWVVKTSDIYSLPVLKSRCQQSHPLSVGAGGEYFPAPS